MGIFNPFTKLFTYTMILFIVLIWDVIKHPIQIKSVIGICILNCLIPSTDADLMGIWSHTREWDESQLLNKLSRQDLILTHYIISTWWIQVIFRVGILRDPTLSSRASNADLL